MAAPKPKPLIGSAKPRIAPPVPAVSDVAGLRETALAMGITLMPWQETAGRYLTATNRDGLLLYGEVCIVVARQQGKTTLMKPYIIRQLRAGKKIVHIAQTRELPRKMFGIIAASLEPELFEKRRGKGGKLQTVWPRFGAGQEEITLANGGSYGISAASRGSARGLSTDLVIIDELREMESNEVIEAAEPTLTFSTDPQIVYLSNAGTERSVVLNNVRDRADGDPDLAYLEWSAAPSRNVSDRRGWIEANPAFGHYPQVETRLEKVFTKHSLANTLATFETENLCRWQDTMREPLIKPGFWAACEAAEITEPRRPFMAIAVDPAGKRASAAIAWNRADDTIGARLLFDVTGDPINVDRLGKDMSDMARSLNVQLVGFDPLTDGTLAKHFRKTQKIVGSGFANATADFVAAVDSKRIQWDHAASVGDDLTWTARKQHDDTGSFQAVRADDAHPITAALAAIRAVGLASAPGPSSIYEDRGLVEV
jgi:hypothetical protein